MTVGGLSEAHLANLSDVLGFTQDVDGIVDSLTMKPGATFHTFQFEKNTASANQALTVGANKFITPTVSFLVAGYDQATKETMDIVSVATMVAIVKLRGSGKFLILGLGSGLEASANEGNSGAGEGDANGFTVTLVGVETEYANEINADVVDSVVVDVDEPTILNIAPLAYSTVGSESMVLTGTNFNEVTAVDAIEQIVGFPETSMPSFVIDSDTQITVTTPAITAGNYKIRVTHPVGNATSAVEIVVS